VNGKIFQGIVPILTCVRSFR